MSSGEEIRLGLVKMLVMVAEADSVDRLQLVHVSIDVHVHAGYTLEAHMHL